MIVVNSGQNVTHEPGPSKEMSKRTKTQPSKSTTKSRATRQRDWRRRIDFFRFQNQVFERDVNVIVLGSLRAGIKQLARDLQKTSERFKNRLEDASAEQEDWIIDEFVDIRADHEDQERFLRNIALVALLSRLTHTLNQLARAGDEISPRNERSYPGENEFQKLWAEFTARFGITLSPRHIQWIEGFRRARNLIVHYGGEANPVKSGLSNDTSHQTEDPVDRSFSRRYSRFLEGKGFNAQVRITQDQLEFAARKAVELTTWLAVTLRAKQMETADDSKAAGLRMPKKKETKSR